jgi:hypothetical protein
LGWNKQQLMSWANREGLDGRYHYDTSKKAADIGTIGHAMVEANLKGKRWQDIVEGLSGVTDEMVATAEKAFGAWEEWTSLVSFKLLESEIALISEEHQFGGTIDLAVVQKKRSILDIKTSKGVYADHKIQLAAYGRLWDENYPDKPIEAYYLLRLGKDQGEFAYYYWPELDDAWEAFKHLRALHDLKNKI